MKVLIVGGGGREHTLAWKIGQSSKVERIYVSPGNAGTSRIARSVSIEPTDIDALADFACKEGVDLTVVGPEAPLVKGIVDRFEKDGLMIFGPSKRAAQIEGSKVFAKELMRKYDIPTPNFEVFESPNEAIEYIEAKGAPIVVKADGLAAGKGSIIAMEVEEAVKAVETIMVHRIFGDSGNKVIVEDYIEGEEATITALTDGNTVVTLASSQDHKRIFDDDRGPNTGGMGAYAPAPVITRELSEQITQRIVTPTINAMEAEGIPYKGVLYAGLMVTNDGPQVLEFNCRFGDPESQVVLPLLRADLLDLLIAISDGRLDEVGCEVDTRAAVCVVIASGGYPGSYEKGKEISGLDQAEELEGVVVFHAGTKTERDKILTNGGRVLGVTAIGKDITTAIDRAYEAVRRISFEGMHYRQDIGYKALKRLQEG